MQRTRRLRWASCSIDQSLSERFAHLDYADALVRAAYPVAGPLLDEKMDTQISQEAILGNLFMVLLAGHETTASTLKFAIYCLACHPKIQQGSQSSPDSLLCDRSAQHCSYETDFLYLKAMYAPWSQRRLAFSPFCLLYVGVRKSILEPSSLEGDQVGISTLGEAKSRPS